MAYRDALEDRYGPLCPLAAFQADVTASFMNTLWQAMIRMNQGTAKRNRGRGRRPSLDTLGRLDKRQGLDYSTYDQALRKLEELVGQNGSVPKPRSGAELMAMRGRL